MKQKQKARINRQRSSEEDRETERASPGEGGETVLNTAVNYSESRTREGDEIIRNNTVKQS